MLKFSVVVGVFFSRRNQVKTRLIARETFDLFLMKLKNPELLSNIERAMMFYFLVKVSFGGERRTFGISATKRLFDLKSIYLLITKAHDRLSAVTIEHLDFRKFIERYDRLDTFFYGDPPYRCETSKNYCSRLTDDDYIELVYLLKHIQGRFMISINDDLFIRDLFKEFRIETVSTLYSVNKSTSKRVEELVIMNY
jgi:DNA adenine methylase